VSESIELANISVYFSRAGGDVVPALRRLSLSVEPSEYVTVVGPNGAGKSTLINVLAGSVIPQEGEVFIGNRRVTDMPDFRRSRWVSRVFQDPTQATCDALSVKENLSLALMRGRGRSPFRLAVDRRRTRQFQELLAVYGRNLENRLDQEVGRLSGGERQLLAVIMGVMQEPSVLLLDEHTSALDPHIGALVMRLTDELVRKQGLTTIMVTHNMRYAAQFGDRLLIMSGGVIVDDIRADEKRGLTEDSLIRRFREALAGELTDRLIGG